MDELTKFKNMVAKKQKQPRINKIKNSYGVIDYYRYYRDINKKRGKSFVDLSLFLKILRTINNRLRDKFSEGCIDLIFPCNLGRLQIEKIKTQKKIVDGKLKTNAFIDWNKTIELWFEDKESFENKKLVRVTSPYKFMIKYNKVKALYTNKFYVEFNTNRELKNKLKKNIRDGKIDAYLAE